jgi:uncharacterized membrane protein YhaH (DUF805 family)
MNWLNGRLNRSTYWLCLILIVAMLVLLRLAHFQASVSEVVLIGVAVPRLHDVGRSGWWAVVAFGVEIAAMILVGVASVVSKSPMVLVRDELGVVALLLFGALGVLGLWPGSRSENRFGPPPGLGIHWRAFGRSPESG